MLRRSVCSLGRFRSKRQQGYVVSAVTGTHCITFGIDADKADTRKLIGFAVSRQETARNARNKKEVFLHSHKAFPKDANIVQTVCGRAKDEVFCLSTLHHPMQSFVIDDHEANPGTVYKYRFYPMTDEPGDNKLLLEKGKPIVTTVKTETSFDPKAKHQIFFNNATVSGQAFEKKFPSVTRITEERTPQMIAAVKWLSRDLNEAVIRFIRSAKKGDTIRGLFYEFNKADLLNELKAASTRGVKVRLVLDLCPSKYTTSPRRSTIKALKKAKLPFIPGFDDEVPKVKRNDLPLKATKGNCQVIARTLRPQEGGRQGSNLQHNKVMILERKGKGPTEVWTGSTNFTVSGLAGQLNVGHWVRCIAVAKKYKAYWDIIAKDLSRVDTAKAVAKLSPKAPVTLAQIRGGITPLFSPRPPEKVTGCNSTTSAAAAVSKWEKQGDNYNKNTLLHLYFRLLAQNKTGAVMTLPFGTPRPLVSLVTKKATAPYMAMMLNKALVSEKEKDGLINRKETANIQYYRELKKVANLDKASGCEVDFAVSGYVVEENSRKLGLSQFVPYIHSKFCVSDPLTKTPIVVTGSANFSDASTYGNDENMIIIKGDKRVADIYFTEFRRVHSHYKLRENMNEFQRVTGKWVKKKKGGKDYYKLKINEAAFCKKLLEHAKHGMSAVLVPDDSWVKGKYAGVGKKQTMSSKRLELVKNMKL